MRKSRSVDWVFPVLLSVLDSLCAYPVTDFVSPWWNVCRFKCKHKIYFTILVILLQLNWWWRRLTCRLYVRLQTWTMPVTFAIFSIQCYYLIHIFLGSSKFRVRKYWAWPPGTLNDPAWIPCPFFMLLDWKVTEPYPEALTMSNSKFIKVSAWKQFKILSSVWHHNSHIPATFWAIFDVSRTPEIYT